MLKCLAVLIVFCSAIPSFAQNESLLIGPGDTLHVQVYDTPEMDQHPRVTDSGNIPLAFVGNVHVSGLSPSAAAQAIEEALKTKNVMKHPQVTVSVDTYATQSVSVMGEVRTPGAYPITTPLSVIDVLARAGGITPAGDRNITIARLTTGKKLTYYLSNKSDVALDQKILVYPGDTIVVPKAALVYILGDVNRPGGYVMDNNEAQLSVLQMLAKAGGTPPTAVPSHARLIRKNPDGTYQDLPLPLSKMQKGKKPDMALLPNDIVYVPFSYFRSFVTATPGIVAAATGAAVYQF
ncbi:polysaccharide biosynthesis/export family protein [Acidipila rosea]|uniref:Polysaccharide export outer membrane protein n=1 Tax=Acidipila rosea TaxID=768535 RepID=A0A4R1LG26_9BACT|nr:polysaccharide biosynthesis/export family protein [Acidipila rosea]TCK75803.1 polysaccharide export outer membrane protein [Acidipila rosea]